MRRLYEVVGYSRSECHLQEKKDELLWVGPLKRSDTRFNVRFPVGDVQ